MNSIEKFNYSISKWAYNYCTEIEDNPGIRRYIINSQHAYHYCKNVRDCKSVMRNIDDPYYALMYYENIRKEPEIKQIADKFRSRIRKVCKNQF